MWVIGGPNGAGKSTLVSRRAAARIPVVNPDDIAVALPRIAGRLDERQAGKIALRDRRELLAAGESFAIETTLTGHSALRFMQQAREADYKITLVFVGLHSPSLSAQRVADRVRQGGHSVPVSALLRRYPDAMARLPQAISVVDRAFVLDNSSERRRLLLATEDTRIRYLARDLPAWFVSACPEFGDHGTHDQ